MRGFRPSYFRTRDDIAEDIEQDKQENLHRYVDRVSRGLPLFEEQPAVLSANAPFIAH